VWGGDPGQAHDDERINAPTGYVIIGATVLAAFLRGDDMPTWSWLIIGGIIIVLLMILFANTCPKCRRRRALERTGRSAEEEWCCRYCGHTLWY